MNTWALLIRGCAIMLAIPLTLVAVKLFISGSWILGLVPLALAAALAMWFWRASQRALADEALRASEQHDASDSGT